MARQCLSNTDLRCCAFKVCISRLIINPLALTCVNGLQISMSRFPVQVQRRTTCKDVRILVGFNASYPSPTCGAQNSNGSQVQIMKNAYDYGVVNNTCVHILNALPMNDSDVTVSCYEYVCDGRGHQIIGREGGKGGALKRMQACWLALSNFVETLIYWITIHDHGLLEP